MTDSSIFKRIIAIETEKPNFNLTWIINNICTNHCDYCPEMLHRGSNHYYSWADAERFADAMIAQHRRIKLSIAGGEPTVSPWLKPLINKFLDSGHWVSVVSNGVRAGEYWEDCRPTHLRLSYHPHSHDDGWIDRAVAAWQRIPDTLVRVMMPADRWDQCLVIYQQLRDVGIGVEVVRIQDWGAKTYDYTLEQEQFFRDTDSTSSTTRSQQSPGFRSLAYLEGRQLAKLDYQWPTLMANAQANRFQGWECDIGKESLFLQFDGSIRKANCEQDGWFARIQDPQTWQWPTNSTLCQQWECQCVTDLRISKRKRPHIPVD
jgi:MoaA/NifB/PqqE/SkfB family radical SAM enzyme